jgi:type I restriction enzyme S subunit
MTIPDYVFAVRTRSLEKYWEVRSVRISLTNRCNWPTESLNNICQIRFEIVPKSEFETRQVQFLDRISFDEGKVFFGNRTQTKMTQYRAKSGDIAVSKINARKRAIGIVPDGVEVGLTIHFRALIPDTSKIDTQYLWLSLRSNYCRNQFDVETGGIGKGEISEERLLGVHVPLPPLEVQRAIVARWQLAQESAWEAEAQIRQIEASAEAQFFSDFGFKPLKLAQKPRVFAGFFRDSERWSVSYNQARLSGVDIEHGTYPAAELGDILSMVQYGTSEKANIEKNGTPVIRMNNIVEGILDLSNLKYIRLPKQELQRLLLYDDDILFNRTNSKELVGKCAVFHEQGDYVFASYLIRVRTESTKANPDYVSFVINSRIGRQQIDALSRQIIGQANVNSEELRSLQIPLPPLEVQQSILERVQASRAEIARQWERAAQIRKEVEAEVEALILGTKKV